MEVKVLDNIIHGVLKPWKLDTTNTRRFTELVKAAKAASPKTNAELLSQLKELLADFPTLQQVLSNEPANDQPLQQLLYKAALPKYKDPITTFYYFVVTAETHRLYNAVLQQTSNLTELVDIRYQVGKILTNTRVLAKQATTELQEQGFTTVPDEQSSFIHFALYYLKHSLIQLYFSVQDTFKDKLKQVTTLEDFYLLDLELPLSTVLKLEYVGPPIEIVTAINEAPSGQSKLSFGFHGDVSKLSTVVNQLCSQVELLNEEKTNAEDLLAVFTSKDIQSDAPQIYVGCETVQFRYIVDKFSQHFNNLNPKAIENSGLFFTKRLKPFTAQNLYSNKISNPKNQPTIDNIFKQMQ
jgi:hypothetical protein